MQRSLNICEDKAHFLLQRDQIGVRNYLIVLTDETMPLNAKLCNQSYSFEKCFLQLL